MVSRTICTPYNMSERQKLVLTFDCDDVLVPTAQLIINAYNEMYGTEVGLDQFYADNPEAWGTESLLEASQRVDVLLRAGITAEAVADEETIAIVEAIARDGHEMHVVTGRQSYQEPVTTMQLNKFFPGIFQSVEHTNMYATGDLAHLRRSKGEVCAALGSHMLVDDHITHGEDVIAAGVEDVVVYGSYPWNDDNERLMPGMVRCHTMQEVRMEVARLASRHYAIGA